MYMLIFRAHLITWFLDSLFVNVAAPKSCAKKIYGSQIPSGLGLLFAAVFSTTCGCTRNAWKESPNDLRAIHFFHIKMHVSGGATNCWYMYPNGKPRNEKTVCMQTNSPVFFQWRKLTRTVRLHLQLVPAIIHGGLDCKPHTHPLSGWIGWGFQPWI